MASITLPAGLPEKVKTILQPDIQTTKLILTETPFPLPLNADDVLVRVHAAAPCNGELMWAKMFPEMFPKDKLHVPCQDLAGTVVSAQPDSGFAVGDDVFCRVDATRSGAGREYTIAKNRELAHKPKSLSWVDAAATPLSSLTAWQALFVHGTLDAAGIRGDAAAREQNGKQRVLITGAGGGVGGWAVQLAALAGAGVVVAVCGPDKEATVKQLGATEVLNYRETSVREWATADAGRQVDLVVDCIGGETLAGCWIAMKEGGTLISVNTPPDMVKPAELNKKLAKNLFFIVDPYGKNLEEIATLMEAGKVKPLVDSVWEMNDFQKAFERLEEGHAKGKIIIKISPEA
ncbi:hypothetical protein DL769_011764 [Monosporascus sp. CRB-8-3]|nr:hypothetical protein DL769_011764 [Monosporascus sp. CRB-8-3]